MKSYLFNFCFLLLFLACSKEDQEKAGISDKTAKEVKKIVSENGVEGCYIPYQAKTCELLDNKLIAQIVGIEAAQLEAKDASKELFEMSEKAKKGEKYEGSKYASCDYSWKDKSGKTFRKVFPNGIELDMPVGGQIALGSFSPMKDIAAFKAMYRNVSQEEIDKAFEKAGDIAKDKGLDTKQVADAKDLGKGLTSGRNVEYLDGFGEIAAVITTKATGSGVEMITLIKGNTFRVYVDIDQKSQAENLEVAKKVATEVIKKCK
jgi:hypothetical protein